MAPRSRFTRLDAFTKTVDEARIRTTSGGVVTIVSLVVILFLTWGEWADYRRTVVHPELVVDKSRSERMEIHLNITFPKIPCDLLTLDLMDRSGEQQNDVVHGISKYHLAPPSQGGGVIDVKDLSLHDDNEKAHHLDPNYCGSCGGAPPPPTAEKDGCCNTCDEVRLAYEQAAWAFGRGENIEQCEREHYADRLDAQRDEGCRVQGSVQVNKVVGNFHFAPGRSFTNGNMHIHDLSIYRDLPQGKTHDFTHHIHHLRFGPELPAHIEAKLGSSAMPWSASRNPLDGHHQNTVDPNFTYTYFVKIVPTSFLSLGWAKSSKRGQNTGELGVLPDGSIETHQYAVTSHKRSLAGGDDAAEGHAERKHAGGGIPGVFFSYDISAMKVINREERSKTFLGFLAGVCAVVGGTLTVAAAVDRGLFEGASRLKKIRSKEL